MSGFALYVQTQYSAFKAKHPDVPHKELMGRLGQSYKAAAAARTGQHTPSLPTLTEEPVSLLETSLERKGSSGGIARRGHVTSANVRSPAKKLSLDDSRDFTELVEGDGDDSNEPGLQHDDDLEGAGEDPRLDDILLDQQSEVAEPRDRNEGWEGRRDGQFIYHNLLKEVRGPGEESGFLEALAGLSLSS